MTTALTKPQRRILAVLNGGPLTHREIVRRLDHATPSSVVRVANLLIDRGLVALDYQRQVGFVYGLTPAGREVAS